MGVIPYKKKGDIIVKRKVSALLFADIETYYNDVKNLAPHEIEKMIEGDLVDSGWTVKQISYIEGSLTTIYRRNEEITRLQLIFEVEGIFDDGDDEYNVSNGNTVAFLITEDLGSYGWDIDEIKILEEKIVEVDSND